MTRRSVTRRPPCAPSEGGFTLIEVVVALAILGTGMVILLESHYASLRLVDEAQTQALATGLLETAVAEAEREVLVGNASGDGDFGNRFPDYTYAFEAQRVDEDNMPGLFEVVVTVTSPSDEHRISFYAYDANQIQDGGVGS